jgi:hypothetical protein
MDLDPLRAQLQAHLTAEAVRLESLPLQLHLLDLVDVLVREGDDARLAVGGLPKEVAHPFLHDECGGGATCGGQGCNGGGAVED